APPGVLENPLDAGREPLRGLAITLVDRGVVNVMRLVLVRASVQMPASKTKAVAIGFEYRGQDALADGVDPGLPFGLRVDVEGVVVLAPKPPLAGVLRTNVKSHPTPVCPLTPSLGAKTNPVVIPSLGTAGLRPRGTTTHPLPVWSSRSSAAARISWGVRV